MHVWKRVRTHTNTHTHRSYYSHSDVWTVAICSLQKTLGLSNQKYLWSTKGGVGNTRTRSTPPVLPFIGL